MAIIRLPPAQNDFNLSITINKHQRPYFTEWYQAEKLDNETPEQFSFRILGESFLQYHLDKAYTASQDDTALLSVELGVGLTNLPTGIE